MNIKISVNKVQMIRPESISKISNSDLNTNWTIDYTEINSKSMEYLCIIDIIDDMFLSFAIQGLIECGGHQILENRFNEFNSLVLDKSVKVMMNILNATKESNVQMDSITENLGPHSTNNFIFFNCRNRKLKRRK